MDKVFAEIKRAIEEEMSDQRTGRPGAPPRSSGPGGREQDRYREWVEQEQERLRSEDGESGYGPGGRPAERYELQAEERATIGPDDVPERDEQRRERPARPADGRTRHDRAEARHERRRDSAYDQRHRGNTAGIIRRQLRAPDGVRRAVLMSEIIGKPVSMRRDDEHLIS